MPQTLFEFSYLLVCVVVLWATTKIAEVVSLLAREQIDRPAGFEVQRVPQMSVALLGNRDLVPLPRFTAGAGSITGFLFISPESRPMGIWQWGLTRCQQYSTQDVCLVCQGSESACADMVNREFGERQPEVIVDTSGDVTGAFGARHGFAVFLDSKQRVVRKGILHMDVGA